MRSSRALRVSLICLFSLAGAACSGGGAVRAPISTSPTSDSSIAPPASSPGSTSGRIVIMGAGDIAEGGTTSQLDAASTGDVIRAAAPNFVFTLGDNAYPSGTPSDYTTKYDPTWGSFKAITKPVPGNHEYGMTPPAAGYIGYYGASVVTNPINGGVYYAWDIGNGWRGYSLNSEISMSPSSAQYAWLQSDLNAHPSGHFIAYWHQPRYVSGSEHTDRSDEAAIWALLRAHGTDIVMGGHEHHYERFAKMNGQGGLDSAGIREFVVGTGGDQTYALPSPLHFGNQFGDALDYGVLKLTLHRNSYDWAFIGSGRGFNGGSVTTANEGAALDSGTQATNNTIGTPTTTTTTE